MIEHRYQSELIDVRMLSCIFKLNLDKMFNNAKHLFIEYFLSQMKMNTRPSSHSYSTKKSV